MAKAHPPKKKSKTGRGKTGVELAFHSKAAYQKLTTAQRVELYEWRQSQKKEKGPTKQVEVSSATATVSPSLSPGITLETLRSLIVSVVHGDDVMNGNASIPKKSMAMSLVDCVEPAPIEVNKIMKWAKPVKILPSKARIAALETIEEGECVDEDINIDDLMGDEVKEKPKNKKEKGKKAKKKAEAYNVTGKAAKIMAAEDPDVVMIDVPKHK